MNNWYDDAPTIEFYSRRTPVAGKDHTCCICKKPIKKGTRHVYTVDKEKGCSLSTSRHHIQCPGVEPC